VDLAVLTFTHLVPAPAGKSYQAWAKLGGTWRSLGLLERDASGAGLLLLDGLGLAAFPDAVQVTVEPAGGSVAPSGPLVMAWPAPE
jgi:anti-sigma-K factor RskA